MKIKISTILYLGVIIQIISTQGILTFNFFKLLGHWELKSFVHPFGIGMILIYVIIQFASGNKKLTITATEIGLFTYLILMTIYLGFNVSSIEGFYFSIRETMLVFTLIFILSNSELPQRQYLKILGILYFLVILNIIFVALTFILGPEEYMKLVTGRYVWANDPLYKFKITNLDIFWRSPALIGESASVGMFGILSYVLFNENQRFKSKRNFALILALLSFTRSVYMILIIYSMLKYLLNKENIHKIKFIVPYLVPVILLLLIPLNYYKLLSIYSLKMRFAHWGNDINIDFNYLFGGNIGKVGSAVRDEGFISVLDSYWLLIFLNLGIVGILLIILFFFEKYLVQNQNKLILLAFSMGAIFITLTQSMPFLVLFPLLFIKNRERIKN